MRKTRIVLAVASLVLAGCANMLHHDEKSEATRKMNDADVPAAVRDSVNKRFPGVSVTSVEREKENGMVVYDYELKQQDGRKYETDVKDDGTIMEVEKQLQGGEIPSSIQTAVSSKYPRATITEVMEVSNVSNGQENKDHYEATITPAGGKDMEVNVSLDGKLQEESQKE
jgi:uncharacterized membrane protein YkoI